MTSKKLTPYYENFEKILNCCVVLDKYYTLDSDIEDIDHDCIELFLRIDLNEEFETFGELYETISQIKIKTITVRVKKHFV